MCVGVAKKDKILPKASGVGNSVVYVGSKQEEMEFMELQWLQQNLMITLKTKDQQFGR